MADYDLQSLSYELNVKSARLARQAADKYETSADKPRATPQFCGHINAGVLGPTHLIVRP